MECFLSEMGTINQAICEQLCECAQPCTRLGEYISQAVVIQASQNIFHEANRSVIELILNSIDAYRSQQGQASVGKFGMGFYSIFEYILGNPLNSIVINSHTQTEHWVSTIRSTQLKKLWYTMNDIPPDFPSDGLQGTKIEIHSEDIPDLSSICNKYLRFISDVKIFFNGQSINTTDSTLVVYVENIPGKYFSVEDRATGIPKDVYLHSMLVPGVSTKQIQHTSMPNEYLGPLTNITQKVNSHLDMLIGEIPILSLSSNDTPGYGIVIQMPAQTGLPVSRDSFLPTTDNIRIYNEQIDYLISIALQDNPRVLYILHKLVHLAYLSMGSPSWMIDRIQHAVNNLPNLGIYYASQNHASSLSIIAQQTGYRFVYVPDRDIPVDHFIQLESRLSELSLPWITDLFYGRQVLILPTLPMMSTNAGFGRFLFLQSYPSDVQKFVLAYPKDVLIPSKSKRIRPNKNLYSQLLSSKLKGLNTYFELIETVEYFITDFPIELQPRIQK